MGSVEQTWPGRCALGVRRDPAGSSCALAAARSLPTPPTNGAAPAAVPTPAGATVPTPAGATADPPVSLALLHLTG